MAVTQALPLYCCQILAVAQVPLAWVRYAPVSGTILMAAEVAIVLLAAAVTVTPFAAVGSLVGTLATPLESGV